MKDFVFSKNDVALIKDLLKHEIFKCEHGLVPQDMDTVNKVYERKTSCVELLKRIEAVE